MADLSINVGNVEYVSGSKDSSKNAGETITAGQAVYLDADTSTWKKADCDASATTAAFGGIALHASLAGQPLVVQTDGDLDVGATLTVGEIYVLSGTAGGIAPVADLATNDYTVVIGVATSASNLHMIGYNSGTLHA